MILAGSLLIPARPRSRITERHIGFIAGTASGLAMSFDHGCSAHMAHLLIRVCVLQSNGGVGCATTPQRNVEHLKRRKVPTNLSCCELCECESVCVCICVCVYMCICACMWQWSFTFCSDIPRHLLLGRLILGSAGMAIPSHTADVVSGVSRLGRSQVRM